MSVQLMVQLSVQLTREPSLLTVVGRGEWGDYDRCTYHVVQDVGTMLTTNGVPWYHGDDGCTSHPAPPVTTDWQENSWRKVAKYWRRVQPITLMVQQILTWSIRRPPVLEHKKISNDVQVNQWMLWQRTGLRKASWLVRNMGLNGGWDRREVGPPWHYL